MEFNFTEYMRDIAIKLKDIAHTAETKKFHRISSIAKLEELLSSSSNAGYPALIVVDNREGRYLDRNSDNLLDSRYYSFYVIKNVANQDIAGREAAIKECETIIKKILGKFFNDMANDNRGIQPQTGLRNLNRDSITYYTIGPIGDNCFGIQVTFTMLQPTGIKYNADDWTV